MLDAPAIDLGHAATRLAELRRRAASWARLACLLTAAGAGTWLAGGEALGISLLVGACCALGLLLVCRSDRRRLLLAIVAQGDADALAEADELARSLSSMRERARLASGLRAAAQAGRTGAITAMVVDAARAADAGAQLEALARALEDPTVQVSPAALALGRRLLSDAGRSPLYNPRVPEHELAQVLDAVRGGVRAP